MKNYPSQDYRQSANNRPDNKADYRGRCESKDKVRKDGQPKRAGNFSYQTFHQQQMQSRDYKVWRNKDGELIVGEHTKLERIFGGNIAHEASTNRWFGEYIERGYKTVGNKQYDAERRLTRFSPYLSSMIYDYEFIYREMIYTDGDFTYNFPEY